VRGEPGNTCTAGIDTKLTIQLCSRYYKKSTLYVDKGGYSSNGKIISLELLSLMAKYTLPFSRHTVRPVLGGTVPVIRALSQRPGQSTKLSRLCIQSASKVPHRGVAWLLPPGAGQKSAPISTPPVCYND